MVYVCKNLTITRLALTLIEKIQFRQKELRSFIFVAK